MDQINDASQLRSKRNNSNNSNKFSHSLPLYEKNIRKNPIKINKNKLPSDWFPRSDSSNKKINIPQDNYNQIQHYPFFKHTESEKLDDSPLKISFFNFFQEEPKQNNINRNKITDRKFQTREALKRNSNTEIRKYTPSTKSQRPQLYDAYKIKNIEKDFIETILSSKINRINKGVQNELTLKYQQRVNFINPQKQQKQVSDNCLTQRKNMIQLDMKGNDPNNITFFNAKSSSLPPVTKNRIKI